MARAKKYTQNINKDVGLMTMPKVKVPHSKWESKHSNYLTSNIGEIVPIYCEEIMPDEKKRITLGMISHMTTPIAPILNAQYTELRAFFVPHRLSADLLAGYKTRKSPFVKVFGEDNASANAEIVVNIDNQKLPDVTDKFVANVVSATPKAFGGILDALDYECPSDISDVDVKKAWYKRINWLSMAAYELIYQKAYRNQNRESATNSNLYKFLFDAFNRNSDVSFDDSFHIAQREKDYFTGSQPFTQKGDPVVVNIGDEAPVKVKDLEGQVADEFSGVSLATLRADFNAQSEQGADTSVKDIYAYTGNDSASLSFYADLKEAKGLSIESLRIMIKLQESLEKDAIYGNDYASALNSKFGTAPMSLVLEEPLELKKVTITSEMQAIFQTSSTSGEQTVLGTIGANATTSTKSPVEVVPMTKFYEWGYLIICAVHKAQNSYDANEYKSKHIFKKARFDFYDPSLNDLGYQKVSRLEFAPAFASDGFDEPVSFNEAWAEYRFRFNKVHGMFEPSRENALDYWTLAISGVADLASLYKQSKVELNRALSVTSENAPQFFDGYGFIELQDKPMTLRSIPGFDGVI